MTTCVIYSFAYVRRQLRSKEELPGAIVAHVGLARAFADLQGYKIAHQVLAWRTSRNTHFAGVTEFREAIRLAKEFEGALLVGSLYELLCATHPDKMDNALATLLTAGVPVLDAKTKHRLTEAEAAKMLLPARRVSMARRAPVMRGLTRSSNRPTARAENQKKAAQGTKRAALTFASGLLVIVAEVRAELPDKTPLARAHLATELNRRGVLTRQGKGWTAENAGRLLRQLNAIS